MAFAYEFVPGRGSHYRGRVRSFVVRKGNRKHHKAVTDIDDKQDQPASSQLVALADSQNLLVGQLDPFNTHGTELDQFENNMLNHYLQFCIPHLGKRTTKQSFFPPRDIDWPMIRSNRMLMSAAVQFAAMSAALIESNEEYRFEHANKYYLKALHMVRRQLEIERSKPTNELLHAIIGLVATDTHIRGLKTSADELESQMSLHIDGLRAALECRDGWNIACYPPILQWEFLWQDIVSNGRISAGKTMFSSHLQGTDITTTFRSGSSFEEQWNRLCILEFIAAYSDFHKAAHFRHHQQSDGDELYAPKILELFSPGTRAYKTMKSDEVAVIRTIAPILMVNIMLFNLQAASPDEVAYQYWALRKKFRACDVDLGSGPAYLLIAIASTTNMKGFAEPQQMSLLARMMGVESKLSPESQTKLKHSLLGFISNSSDGFSDECWKPEDLRYQMRLERIMDT